MAERSPPDAAGAPGPLPAAIADLVRELASTAGVQAVALGGSRAAGRHHAGSDWDLGVYYRGQLDTSALARHGEVHRPGAWGRIMNGGAWLTLDGLEVDVLFRDLAAVEHWSERAGRGEFEVDLLLGYLAGCPTYSLCAELDVARVLAGTLPVPPPFPAALAASAPPHWRFRADFSLEHARMRAARGEAAGAVGQAAKAAVEQAYALLAEASTWVLNEKGILERAGLDLASSLFLEVPRERGALPGWVEAVAVALGRPRGAGFTH